MPIRTLIVDDEPLAREGLRDLLTGEQDVQIVGECRTGLEAAEAIDRGGVDLVLLDVQMPQMDGFEVLGAVDPPLPAVIFVTAHDEYALRAFRVHAVDYLLKPVEEGRLHDALARVRERLRLGHLEEMTRRMDELLRDLRKHGPGPDRLLVKSRGRAFFVKTADIDWIEAEGNYARIHIGDDAHLVRETMTGLTEWLEPVGFARIHRSTIVNLDRVQEIQPWFKGDQLVILHDGTRHSLTRKYRARLEELIGGNP